jgi:AbrB family looped-hinge helix DNA binding protein
MDNNTIPCTRLISETATVTSKSMVNIPVRIRKKYSIKEGSKIVFVENEETGRIEIIPVPPLSELFGTGRAKRESLIAGIRELEDEHRREASVDR